MSGTGPAQVVVVTGTGTSVGKTVVTAAVAALATAAGRRVAVVKPAQTGVAAGEPGDLDDVRRLTGIGEDHLYELARYPLPLAPATAARLSGLPALDLDACARLVADLGTVHDLVLVEGAGGLLVRLRDDPPTGLTLADLAVRLDAGVLVVVGPALGTLNHTALTLEALARRDLACTQMVIGRWPGEPDLASRTNIGDLETLAGHRLCGALPDGMGALPPGAFRLAAAAALGPEFGGDFDAADFRRQHATAAPTDREE
jgi:dethiobiotin synthetase